MKPFIKRSLLAVLLIFACCTYAVGEGTSETESSQAIYDNINSQEKVLENGWFVSRRNFIYIKNWAIGSFADIDGDNDMDFLVPEGQSHNSERIPFDVFENQSTKNNLKFEKKDASHFFDQKTHDQTNTRFECLSPALGDLDNDGDLDMFLGMCTSSKRGIYMNIGTKQIPKFKFTNDSVIDEYVLSDPFARSYLPTFVDIDDDGDLDLFVAVAESYMHFFENIGDKNKAKWKLITKDYTKNFTNLNDSYGETVSFVDIDDDGDYDLFTSYDQGVYFFENIGTKKSAKWKFISKDYFKGEKMSYAQFHKVDLLGDGVKELISTSYHGKVLLWKKMPQ